MTLFIAKFVHGREKYEYHCDCLGVFTTEKDAALALFDHLVAKENIFCPFFYDEQEENSDHDQEQDQDSEIMIESKKPSRQDDIDLARQNLENYANLDEECENNGDSYYEDGWRVEIDQCVLNVHRIL